MTLVSFIVAMLAISCGSCTIGKAWEDLHLSLLNPSTCFDTSYSHPCMGYEDDSKLALLFPLLIYTHISGFYFILYKGKSPVYKNYQCSKFVVIFINVI